MPCMENTSTVSFGKASTISPTASDPHLASTISTAKIWIPHAAQCTIAASECTCVALIRVIVLVDLLTLPGRTQ